MSHEITVPLLPCASVDDIVAFYQVLGFRTTYRQRKPNPYASLQREDLNLHFFEMAGFDPAQSYGSCLVLTRDIEQLHRAFAAGMRAAYGKVLVTGTPRMTRPRPRKNYDGVSGFSVIDPGGNWIRIVHHPAPAAAPGAAGTAPAATEAEITASATAKTASAAPGPGLTGPGLAGPTAAGTTRAAAGAEPAGRLERALANAVVQADSRGDARQAARILDSALSRPDAGDDPVTLVEVLVYRAEVAMVLDDPATATEMLARVDRVTLSPDAANRAAAAYEAAADLTATLP